MSKAFLRESDDSADDPGPGHISALPPGTKNYLTADGARRLQAELKHLRTDSRPPLVAHITDFDAKKELQRVDYRIRRIEHSLSTAEVVEPVANSPESVQFGTTVTVRDSNGVSDRYRIVGVDEIDAERGWISFNSPLAKALAGARPGQRVTFQTPRGPAEIEIIAIVSESEPAEI